MHCLIAFLIEDVAWIVWIRFKRILLDFVSVRKLTGRLLWLGVVWRKEITYLFGSFHDFWITHLKLLNHTIHTTFPKAHLCVKRFGQCYFSIFFVWRIVPWSKIWANFVLNIMALTAHDYSCHWRHNSTHAWSCNSIIELLLEQSFISIKFLISFGSWVWWDVLYQRLPIVLLDKLVSLCLRRAILEQVIRLLSQRLILWGLIKFHLAFIQLNFSELIEQLVLTLKDFVELSITLSKVLLDLGFGCLCLRSLVWVIELETILIVGKDFVDFAVPAAWTHCSIDAFSCVHYLNVILLINIKVIGAQSFWPFVPVVMSWAKIVSQWFIKNHCKLHFIDAFLALSKLVLCIFKQNLNSIKAADFILLIRETRCFLRRWLKSLGSFIQSV